MSLLKAPVELTVHRRPLLVRQARSHNLILWECRLSLDWWNEFRCGHRWHVSSSVARRWRAWAICVHRKSFNVNFIFVGRF